MLQSVIKNIENQSCFYANAILPFTVKATDKLFNAYRVAGYDFGNTNSGDKNKIPNGEAENDSIHKLFEFFKLLGKAKHEPCGEHWEVSYAESAWRMAIMAMCLTPEINRKRVAKIALASAFTW